VDALPRNTSVAPLVESKISGDITSERGAVDGLVVCCTQSADFACWTWRIAHCLPLSPYFRAAYVFVKLLRVFVTLNVPSGSADTLIQNAGPV